MKLLVTGTAGFIGSHFVKYVLKTHKSYRITTLDKLTYAGNLKNLREVMENKRHKFIKGDICNEKLVGKLMQGCDAVVNFAAETHVDRSIGGASQFLKTNVQGVYVLLEAAKKLKIKRFLQIGTDEVYGSILKEKFSEKDRLNPGNPYSASKAAADHLVLSYYNTFDVPVLITRSSNNYGPNQYPEKVIPLFITNALKNKPLPMYGDGLNKRNWIYVEDNCKAIDIVLHKGKIGEIYNIGGANEITNLELTKLLLKLLNKPESLISFVTDRLGHDRRYALDCRKVRTLGFAPKISFKEGLKRTISWYCEHPNW